jgi:hypothetical protein
MSPSGKRRAARLCYSIPMARIIAHDRSGTKFDATGAYRRGR